MVMMGMFLRFASALNAPLATTPSLPRDEVETAPEIQGVEFSVLWDEYTQGVIDIGARFSESQFASQVQPVLEVLAHVHYFEHVRWCAQGLPCEIPSGAVAVLRQMISYAMRTSEIDQVLAFLCLSGQFAAGFAGFIRIQAGTAGEPAASQLELLGRQGEVFRDYLIAATAGA